LQAPKPDPRVEQTTARGLCLASRHETNPRRTPIHGHDFKRWRKSLDLSQKAAAARLGLKRRVVQYYEKGERDGKEIDIPKYVRLACFAVVKGAEDYEGPEDTSAEKPKRKRKAKGKANSQAKERKAKHKGTPAAPKPARDKAKPRAAAAPMKKEKPRAGKERR
jgi:transcriptional regulator with XRE-family HTH domain